MRLKMRKILFFYLLASLKNNGRNNTKTSDKGNKFLKPWFDEECKLAVSNRNDTLDEFIHNINTENKI